MLPQFLSKALFLRGTTVTVLCVAQRKNIGCWLLLETPEMCQLVKCILEPKCTVDCQYKDNH